MPRGFSRSVSLLALAPAAPLLEDVLVGVQPFVPLPLTAPLIDGAADFNVTLTLQLRSEVALPAGRELTICSEWAGARQHALPALDVGTTTVHISLEARNVRLWWPHELRPASQPVSKLYSFNVSIASPSSAVDSARADTHGEFSAVLTRRIGFRVAELVQDPPAVGNGTLWQWRINGVLLYVRGANVIPFDALTTRGRVGLPQFKSVVGSAVAAHMQMLRIWGGGQYLASEFYDVCDELGVLVWQEVAFACAIYPAHAEFAASVRAEIRHQTTRLSAHPSLVLWCGNNEAEQNEEMQYPSVWKQYYALAYDVIIQTLREQLDSVHSNVQIWPSSPSNGLQQTWSSPQDYTRGDVHRYVYFGDCTDSSLYGPLPRFQSEFGFPSYPQESELVARSSHPTDLAIYSRFNIARQDLNCPLSNFTLEYKDLGTRHKSGCQLPMLTKLLPLPPGGWAQQSLAVWRHSLYAGQVAQALCVEAQAAHLRRGRDTAAQTGGSLFWQLNSEWPGGSKSSLEHDGGWKVLMHHAQRFYAPFAASAFLTNRYGNYSVHLANDRSRPLHARWELEVWRYNETTPMRAAWCPLHPGGCALTLPPGSGRTVLDSVRHNSLTHMHTNVSQGLFLRVVARTADGDVSSTFTPLGGRGLAGAEGLAADARVTLTVHANRSVTMLSDAVVPHAWLRLRPPAAPLPGGATTSVGRFSKNALLLLPNQATTVDLLPLPGSELTTATITVHEMQQRLTVDCFNRLGGCSVAEAAQHVLKTDDVPTELAWLHSDLPDHNTAATSWRQDRFAISFFAQTHKPPIDDASFQLMRDGNFTMVGLFDHLGKNKVDAATTALQQRLCEKYDLKCLLSLENFKKTKNGSRIVPQLSSTQWGFYLADEPSAHVFPSIAKDVAAVRQEAPGSMSFINLLPSNVSGEGHGDNVSGWAREWGAANYSEYAQKFVDVVKPDVVCFDHYPVFHANPTGTGKMKLLHDTREDYIRNLAIAGAVAHRAKLPMWLYFNIVPYRSLHYGDPTEAQIRWQISIALAYGATGILYFEWHPMADGHPGLVMTVAGPPVPSPHYFQAQRLNSWVLALAPVLLHAVPTEAVNLRYVQTEYLQNASALGLPPSCGLQQISHGDWTLGFFDLPAGSVGSRALLLVNYADAFVQWSTITWQDAQSVSEIDGHSGQPTAVKDDAPGKSGLQLRFEPGEGRLFVFVPNQ